MRSSEKGFFIICECCNVICLPCINLSTNFFLSGYCAGIFKSLDFNGL